MGVRRVQIAARVLSPPGKFLGRREPLGISVGEKYGGDELCIELGIQRQLVILDLLGQPLSDVPGGLGDQYCIRPSDGGVP